MIELYPREGEAPAELRTRNKMLSRSFVLPIHHRFIRFRAEPSPLN